MTDATTERVAYDPHAVQDRWLPVWDRLDLYRAGRREGAPKKYVLDMFPYPSGDLHMGHAEAYGLCDVLARYWMRRGFDVLHPIGWDSFGLPAENAAIKRDEHPATYTYANVATQAESFRRYAISFDWTRRLHTSDPEYYRWTQWLFLRFRERGLAYRKSSAVNWCPNDQTVLANEQVVQGACERCGAQVTKRELTQWFFKVTDYADRLLDDMEPLRDTWPARVLKMQENWIGRSQGAHVSFDVGGPGRHRLHDAARHAVRRDVLRGRRRRAAGAGAVRARPGPRAGGLPRRRAQALRHRPAVDRPAQDRRRPRRHGAQPGDRRADPGLRRRLRPGRLRHRRDHGGARARPARPRLRPRLRPAGAGRRRHRRARPGRDGRRDVRRRRARQQRPLRRAAQGRGDRAHRRRPRGPRRGQGRHQLPAARLAAVAAAVLGRADPDRALRDVRRGGRPRRPAARAPARPAGRGPQAGRHLAAGRGDRLGADDVPVLRGPGDARHRHDGHLRRLVLVLPALLLARLPGRAVRPRGRARVDAGRAVRRRRRARDPAPALQPLLHEGAARHGHGRRRRALRRAHEPGPGHQPGQGHEQVAGQRRRPGQGAVGVRRRRGAPVGGLRRAARGRHRLGRRVTRRLGEVPRPRGAAGRGRRGAEPATAATPSSTGRSRGPSTR